MLTLTFSDSQIARLTVARMEYVRACDDHKASQQIVQGESAEAREARRHALFRAVRIALHAQSDAQEAVWREALGDRFDEIMPLLT